MKKMFLLFTLLFIISVTSILAQDDEPACGVGDYWLVSDNSWSGVWERTDGNIFEARWSQSGEDDISATLNISLDGNDVLISRVDDPNEWGTLSCEYTGEIGPDGFSVSGTNVCETEDGTTEDLIWSGTIVCGTPVIDWSVSATSLRAAQGSEFTFFCPPTTTAYAPVWGTDIHTSDSSICTAAVHAGVITMDGGVIVIEMLPGEDEYEGSEQNGIESSDYGPWEGSFSVTSTADTIPYIAWNYNLVSMRGLNRSRFTFDCSPQRSTVSVWGTDIYTDDSSVCGAALHAGVIDAEGGLVTVEILPGQESYTGSTRNDITTSDYGEWAGSFTFTGVSAQLPTPQTDVDNEDFTGSWDTTYGDMTLEDDGGTYAEEQGRLYFESVSGTTVTGYWVEEREGNCKEEYEGSTRWGRIEFEFNASFTEFSGVWSFCEETPEATWNGVRAEE